jgi:outer membrane autotransporter protein
MDVQGALDVTQLQAAKPFLFDYALSTAPTTGSTTGQQSLYATPQAGFVAAAAGMGPTAQSVASHLQANFSVGAIGLGTAFAQMANGIQDGATYRAALNSLGNESQQAVGTARLAASHAFVERMNSCPVFDGPADAGMHERECVWGRAIDNRADANAGANNHAGYTADSQSMQFGGQMRIADGWFVGGSAAYDTTNFRDTQAGGGVTGKGTTIGAVLKHEVGAWTFSGAVDFNQGAYNTVRDIAFPGYNAVASGEFHAHQVGLHGRIAYTIPEDNWYLKPYLDLHAVHINTGSYVERGAGSLGLAVSGSSDTMLTASPMLEVGGRWQLDNGMVVRPYAAIGGVLHDKNNWSANSQLIGSAPGVAPLTAESTAPTRLAKVKLGLDVSVSKQVQLRVEYGGQFGKDYHSHEGILRFNYLF